MLRDRGGRLCEKCRDAGPYEENGGFVVSSILGITRTLRLAIHTEPRDHSGHWWCGDCNQSESHESGRTKPPIEVVETITRAISAQRVSEFTDDVKSGGY